jgi:hypothetical protein
MDEPIVPPAPANSIRQQAVRRLTWTLSISRTQTQEAPSSSATALTEAPDAEGLSHKEIAEKLTSFPELQSILVDPLQLSEVNISSYT